MQNYIRSLDIEVVDRRSPPPQLLCEVPNALSPSIARFRFKGSHAQERRALVSVELLPDQPVDLASQALDGFHRVLWIAATHEQPSGKSRTNPILLKTRC